MPCTPDINRNFSKHYVRITIKIPHMKPVLIGVNLLVIQRMVSQLKQHIMECMSQFTICIIIVIIYSVFDQVYFEFILNQDKLIETKYYENQFMIQSNIIKIT